MKGLLFLSRVAFICNLLFLTCLVLRYKGDFIGVEEVKSMLGVLGWFMAPFVNLGVNIWYGLRLIKKSEIPVWLAAANFVFLLVQVYVHLF